MRRGDVCWYVCWYVFNPPDKRRPVLVLTRDSAIAILHSVTVAPITSTIRNIPTEVVLAEQDGMPSVCAANFDKIQTVPKNNIGERIMHLSARKMSGAAEALAFALDLPSL